MQTARWQRLGGVVPPLQGARGSPCSIVSFVVGPAPVTPLTLSLSPPVPLPPLVIVSSLHPSSIVVFVVVRAKHVVPHHCDWLGPCDWRRYPLSGAVTGTLGEYLHVRGDWGNQVRWHV